MGAAAAAILSIVFAISIAPSALAQSTPDCSKEIGQMQPCLAFVSGQVTVPSSDCCTALESVHVNRPVCLCVMSGTAKDTPGVNSSSMSILPNICKVDTDAKRCPELLKGSGGAPSTPSASERANSTDAHNGVPLVAAWSFTSLVSLAISIM